MEGEIENRKKSRKVLRSSVTKVLNELDTLLKDDSRDSECLEAALELANGKYDNLQVLDREIYELLLNSASEEDLVKEMDTCDTYTKKFIALRIKYNKVTENDGSGGGTESNPGTSRSSPCVVNPVEVTGMRKFKLPRIEFKQYDGDIKGWLVFWAQFKKVHEDTSIECCDKIEYLRQATVPGSRARQLVESYPAMSDNYSKILDSMQSRFGREDLQIEVYVRELLRLILSNSTSQGIMDIGLLYDRLETQLRALETLGITSDKCAAILFPLIESCLPNELLRVWQRSTFNGSTSDLETKLKKIMVFLQQEVEHEQRITLASEGFGLGAVTTKLSSLEVGSNKSVTKSNRSFVKRATEFPTAAGLMNCEAARCIFCDGSHESQGCFKAQKMSSQKKDILAKGKACFRCVKIGHQSTRCRGRTRCVVCSRSHVTLMCPDLAVNQVESKPQESTKSIQSPPQQQVLTNQTSTHVFLQTLRVTLKGFKGEKVVRALIDTGSQRSYVLNQTAIELGLPLKRQEKVVHCLFGGIEALKAHHCYEITMSKGSFSYTFEVLDQPKICTDVAPIFQGPWTDELQAFNIEISDVGDWGPIELLLGADVSGRLLTGGRRELACGLFALETTVGWTLMGKIPAHKMNHCDSVATFLSLLVTDAKISDLWDLETIGIKEPTDKHSKEEMAEAAKDFFLETIKIDDEARYTVRLPWFEDHAPLPTNYGLAQKRLSSTIRKLKNEGLFQQYCQVFEEWLKEGIIERAVGSASMQWDQGHYLPHRPVIKREGTTKIRPVFDASAHGKNSPSLNHCLEKGPNLIELIPSILLKFRENKVGIISDIRKAFLQIGIDERDRDYLKFLWVDSEDHEIIFRHKRVVFGLNSSPFLLAATLDYHLSQCLQDYQKCESVYSRNTIERLRHSFYVDNCVTSLPDEKSATEFIQESILIMAKGQFDLRGWERSHSDEPYDTNESPNPVLGLNWMPKKDVIELNGHLLHDCTDIENKAITKRMILSLTQQIFDPIGFSCPVVLIPKIMLQNLWEKNLTWDQPVDEVTARSFKVWVKNLPSIMKIQIPRWILVGDQSAEEVSLHTFCDASQNAYACAVFLRVKLHGRVTVFLLAAKSRVAPLKRSGSKMTIPRLELLAATIGARLCTNVLESLDQRHKCYFWSDSSTVISWIQRKEEWGVFVWNRVSEIRSLTPAKDWHHLPGTHNPADLPSRGCSPQQLLDSRWWEGPSWLYEAEGSWPSENIKFDEDEVYAERKKKLVTTLINVGCTDFWNIDYFSKFTKTVRMMAYVFRFIHNSRHPDDRRTGELLLKEQVFAENFVFKVVQRETFCGADDPRIASLGPFCDEEGLIRLRSRVSNREDTDNYRFPIVLPAKHFVVNRVILDTHVKSCHVGTQGLLGLLRENYWILGGRRTVRAVISKCVICKRFDGKPLKVEPPPLPIDRVREAVAFEVIGVDFAGPLFLRNGEKTWVCLFTCAIFRAVHLELCTSLSTACFLQAFRRFVARRGRPKTVYSDNGTNFVGAENAFASLNWDIIVRESSIQRIQWRFNPPTAPWWGGFWERLIGVLKTLLRKTLGRASLDYEELASVLCECESVINARPLTYLSEDPKDFIALCPSMFLRDQYESGLPDCDAVDNMSLCKRLRKIQSFRESLRSRFRIEYLGQLKLFYDKRDERSVKVGDLVIVGSDNTKKLDWPVARVVEVLPGKDGKVRLARVETSRGRLLRPAQRLYPLECCPIPKRPERVPEVQRAQGDEQCKEPGDDEDPSLGSDPQDNVSAEVPSRVPKVNAVKVSRVGRVVRKPSRFDDL